MLDEGRGRQIGVNVLPGRETVLLQADGLGGQRLSCCRVPRKTRSVTIKEGRCSGHRVLSIVCDPGHPILASSRAPNSTVEYRPFKPPRRSLHGGDFGCFPLTTSSVLTGPAN